MSEEYKQPWIATNTEFTERVTWFGVEDPQNPIEKGRLLIHFRKGQVAYSLVGFGWYILIESMVEENVDRDRIDLILSGVTVELENEETIEDIERIESVLDLSKIEVAILKRLHGVYAESISSYGRTNFHSTVVSCMLAAFLLHNHRERARTASWSRASATTSGVTTEEIKQAYSEISPQQKKAMEQVINFSVVSQDTELPEAVENRTNS